MNIDPDMSTLIKEPGDDVSLTCYSAGQPPPKVFWRKLVRESLIGLDKGPSRLSHKYRISLHKVRKLF